MFRVYTIRKTENTKVRKKWFDRDENTADKNGNNK